MTVNVILPTTKEGRDELELLFSKIYAEMIANIINKRDDLSLSEKMKLLHKIIDKKSSCN